MARWKGRLGRWAIAPKPPESPGGTDIRSPFEGTHCQTLIAETNQGCELLDFPHLLSAVGKDRKSAINMAPLDSIMARQEGRYGRAEMAHIWMGFFGKRGQPIAISTHLVAALVADKDCSIWPITPPLWRKRGNGVANRTSVAAIRVRKEGRFGRWEIGRGSAMISWRLGPSVAMSTYRLQGT